MNQADLLTQIQFEQKNLERDHCHYSVDREPDTCARLIAQGVIADVQALEAEVEDLLSKVNAHLRGDDWLDEDEGIPINQTGRRMHTTVTNWDDAESAIKMMCDRWRELRKR